MVVHGRQRLLEQARVIPAVIRDVRAQRIEAHVVGHPRGRDEVAAPHLRGIDVQPVCDGIDHALADKGRFEAAGTAVCPRWRLVGEDARHLAAIRGHEVRPGEHGRG